MGSVPQLPASGFELMGSVPQLPASGFELMGSVPQLPASGLEWMGMDQGLSETHVFSLGCKSPRYLLRRKRSHSANSVPGQATTRIKTPSATEIKLYREIVELKAELVDMKQRWGAMKSVLERTEETQVKLQTEMDIAKTSLNRLQSIVAPSAKEEMGRLRLQTSFEEMQSHLDVWKADVASLMGGWPVPANERPRGPGFCMQEICSLDSDLHIDTAFGRIEGSGQAGTDVCTLQNVLRTDEQDEQQGLPRWHGRDVRIVQGVFLKNPAKFREQEPVQRDVPAHTKGLGFQVESLPAFSREETWI